MSYIPKDHPICNQPVYNEAEAEMDAVVCFEQANPNAKQTGEIMYNGMIIPVYSTASLTDVSNTHFVEEANMFTNIVQLGNTGEYIAISVTE